MKEQIINIRTLKAAWEDSKGNKDEKKCLHRYQKAQKALKKKLQCQPLTLKLKFDYENSKQTELPIAISAANFEIKPQMVKQIQELYMNNMYEKDTVKHFVSGDIFHKSNIPLTYLNGAPVPKDTPVLVPACSAQTQALIIGLYKMSEQAILEGEELYTLSNVKLKNFESVQDFAQYMAINYSLDRGFRGKEKVKITSLATHNEFMEKVHQTSEQFKMPVSTAIKYYTQGKLLTTNEWTKAYQGKVLSSVKYDLSVGDSIIRTLQKLGLGECLKKRYLIDAIAELINTKSTETKENYGTVKVLAALASLETQDVENILADPSNICNIFSILKPKVNSQPLLSAA